ncbi:protein TMED8 [Dendrobates tinctorius]|uniref:protein TMED8 n=1 Tax=Dendrobates tinctorius TaxID=92724 RepID=UPI003CCA315C
MALAQDAAAVSGALSGTGGADSEEAETAENPETGGNQDEGSPTPGDGATLKNRSLNETGASVPTLHQATPLVSTQAESSLCDNVNTTRPTEQPEVGEGAASTEPPKDASWDAITTSAELDATEISAGHTTTSAGSTATDATTTSAGHVATTSAGHSATTTRVGSSATTTSAGHDATTSAGHSATTTSAGSTATDATTTSAGHVATTSAGHSATTTRVGSGATTTSAGHDATTSAGHSATTTSAGSTANSATITSAGHVATMTNTGHNATKTSAGHTATPNSAGSTATDATTSNAGHDATMTSAGHVATTTSTGNVATTTSAGHHATTTNQTVVTTKTTTRISTAEPTKSALDKELEALLSLASTDPPPHDVLMIQSEYSGTTDIVKADPRLEDPSVTEGKVPPCPLSPATTWTSANLREFKHRMANEKHGLLTVRRGEVMTVRVPTHPDGKRLCWEFATDDYDIGFGIYFDWTPVTSTAVTLQVSESSDEEEEDAESPWHSREGDVERGSVYRLRNRYGEIMQVYRRDSHREVQAGNHEYPGEGVYLLKLDNSYSLLRNKTLYFHVYYSS